MSNRKIIAVDFDGTIVTNKFPDIGEPIWSTYNALLSEQWEGARLILWTCRRDEQLTAAVNWCKALDLEFEAVNENLPEIIDAFGGDTRKIYADEYWDDRAVAVPLASSRPPNFQNN